MTFKQTVLMLLLAVASTKATAQKFDMGKVSIAELEEKEHPKDPSAVAAILFEKGDVSIQYLQSEGFVMYTDVKARIKIYKKEGYEWATKQVPYWRLSSNRENVSFDDAVTYNLVDGQIVKTKLKSEGEFDEAINKYWGRKKITMPAVKEGSVIEYSYRVKSPNLLKIDDWKFQTSIPVNYSEYKTRIPEYYVYQPNQKGFIFPKVTTNKVTKSITFTDKERSEGMLTRTSFTTEKVDYTETQTVYTAQDMPAMKDEMYVNNIDNYTSSVGHELSLKRFPNAPLKTFSTDWETVTKKIYESEDFGSELNKNSYFEQDLKAVLANLKTRDEMISATYNFVKSNVKWNGFTNYFCNDGVKAAYKNKTGNAAEINLMLTAMLRSEGINANPVLISTRSNGIALFPNLTAFNYVICAVETPDGLILLDATEKYAVPNVLPLRDLNWFGRLIRKDGTSQSVELMPKAISKEITFMNYTVKPDGSVEGKIRNQFTEQEALGFRQKHLATNNESYLESLESRNNNIEINEYKRENELDLSKPLTETFSFKDNKSVEVINGKIYLRPLLFLTEDENPFKQEKREYPVDFGYPTQDKWMVNIEIPEGYTVESMPKPAVLSAGDEVGNYKYMIGNTGNKIQVTISVDINTAILSSEYYETIKTFFQKMIAQQTERIVLVKA